MAVHKNRFDEDFDFKEPAKGNVESYLNWYMYYEIGAERHASKSLFVKELKDFSLVGYDFSNKDLYCIRFENCNLSSCRFNNSNLYNASFINCIICYADFSKAILEGAKFRGCKLLGSSFEGCSSYDVSFECSIGFNVLSMMHERDPRALAVACEPLYRHTVCDAEMRMINKNKLPLPDFSYFETIDSVDYPYRIFMNSWWERAFCYFESLLVGPKDMLKNHFYDKDVLSIAGVDFSNADLSGYDLSGMSFYKCKFSDTDFSLCCLRDATFRNCSIEACDFSKTVLGNTAFKGCLLYYPKLKQEQLKDFDCDLSLCYEMQLVD